MRRRAFTLGLILAMLTLALPTAASARDRDRDGLSDRWEKKHKLSLKRNSAHADLDRDKVDNANEYRERTDPRDADSDNDGKSDGREDTDRDELNNRSEDATGNDPRDPDTDDDGIKDGKERAGTIVSLKDGLLTIDLANSSSVSALVTDETDFRCMSEKQAESLHGRSPKAGKSTDEESEEGEGEGEDEEPGDESGESSDDDLESDIDEDSGSSDDGTYDGHRKKHCSSGKAAPGRGVHEAKLRLTSDGLVFKRVTLLISR